MLFVKTPKRAFNLTFIYFRFRAEQQRYDKNNVCSSAATVHKELLKNVN